MVHKLGHRRPNFQFVNRHRFRKPVSHNFRVLFIPGIDGSRTYSWVYGPQAPNDGSHKVYTPSESSTPIEGESFGITYLTGSRVSGSLVQDTVAFGSVSVPRMAVGVADSVGVGDYLDGMMGLSWGNTRMLSSAYPSAQKFALETNISSPSEEIPHIHRSSPGFSRSASLYLGPWKYIKRSHGPWRYRQFEIFREFDHCTWIRVSLVLVCR